MFGAARVCCSSNTKPVLDPWAPTTGSTAAQKLQYGGYQFYSDNNFASIDQWYILLEVDVVFTDKN